MAVDITIIGADGTRLDVNGRYAGRQGIILAAGQVQGIYAAPLNTEWTSAAREVGGRQIGSDRPVRDLSLGFHLFGDEDERGYEWLDSTLQKVFPTELDPWDPDAQLARMYVRSKRDVRKLCLQQYKEPDFDPEDDPFEDEYGNPIYQLRAGQPMWEGRTRIEAWETDSSSGSGFIPVSNPTPLPMFQTWVITRGKWTISDTSWIGPKGKRVPGGEFGGRTVALKKIDDVHAGARINLDQMKLMVESWSGTNLLGDLAGENFFMHEIPPYTPETLLPISVTEAPSTGARAELHQPRLWPTPWGGEWR